MPLHSRVQWDNLSPNLYVGAFCAVKTLLTVAIWKLKTTEVSSLSVLELASSTITDGMVTAGAAYAILRFSDGKSKQRTNTSNEVLPGRPPPKRTRPNHSKESGCSDRTSSSAASNAPNASMEDSIISSTSRTSIIRHRTNVVPFLLDRFLQQDHREQEADFGRMAGLGYLDPVTRYYLTRARSGSISSSLMERSDEMESE